MLTNQRMYSRFIENNNDNIHKSKAQKMRQTIDQ